MELTTKISSVYAITSKQKKGCHFKSCSGKQCICMDFEQAALLLQMDSDTIDIRINEEKKIAVVNDSICKRELGCPDSDKKCLMRYVNELNADELSSIWKDLQQEFGDTRAIEWFCLFPLLYYINSSNNIDERASCLHLGVHSSLWTFYLHIFFRSLICSLIESMDDREKTLRRESRVKFMVEKLVEMVSDASRDSQRKPYMNAFDEYIKAVNEVMKDGGALAEILIERREQIEKAFSQPCRTPYGFLNNELRKVNYLCKILIQVMRLLNLDYTSIKEAIFLLKLPCGEEIRIEYELVLATAERMQPKHSRLNEYLLKLKEALSDNSMDIEDEYVNQLMELSKAD